MTDALDTMFYIIVLVVSILGIQGTPTLSIGLPSLATLTGFAGREDEGAEVKPFSGVRVKNDSLRMVYYNAQTIAVVELGPAKLLLNCELLEVYEQEYAKQILSELRSISKPLPISFKEMIVLMNQCQMLDSPLASALGNSMSDVGYTDMTRRTRGRGFLENNPFTLFSGIIPGTKWCGTGDLAVNYHDLGRDMNMDKCCRTHDLCPMKIRAYSQRYNLTNDSLYSKSHCECDDILYDCLKRVNTPTAHLMGNIYFNIVQVPCIEEGANGQRRFRNARNNF